MDTVNILGRRNLYRVYSSKGPKRHAYAWQIGPFWQDTLDIRVYRWYTLLAKAMIGDSMDNFHLNTQYESSMLKL